MSEDETTLPSSDDVLRGIRLPEAESASAESAAEADYVRRFSQLSIEAELRFTHLTGIRDHYAQKGKWSKFLMWTVGGMVGFQSVLLLFVGLDWLDFRDYEWLLPALLVQNLGQVIGLAVYAVKYLFSDISDQKPD